MSYVVSTATYLPKPLLTHDLLWLRQVDIERRFAVEIADDLAVIDVKSAVQLVGRGIGVELLNADLVLARRDVANLELPSCLVAFGDPGCERLAGINVRLNRDLNIAVLADGNRLAIAHDAPRDGNVVSSLAAAGINCNSHQQPSGRGISAKQTHDAVNIPSARAHGRMRSRRLILKCFRRNKP